MGQHQWRPSLASTGMALRDCGSGVEAGTLEAGGGGRALVRPGRATARRLRAVAFAALWLVATHLLGYCFARTVTGHPDEIGTTLLALGCVVALAAFTLRPDRSPAGRQ